MVEYRSGISTKGKVKGTNERTKCEKGCEMKRICVSINDDDADWLELYNASPSLIFQNGVEYLRNTVPI